MSIITPKLDYARHRNTSRSKINKSTLELKDATNLQNNQYDLLSQQEISTPSVQGASNKSPKPLKEEKGAPDDLANLFGQNNFYSGNLDYLTGLINTNKSTTNKSRDPSNTKGRKAHQRTRSTLQGVSPQNLKIEPTVNNENIEPSLKVQTPQIALSLQTPISIGTTQASSLKPDIEYETGVLTLDMEKSPTPRHNFSQREPNNTPVIKEERLFDQFFQKGGLIRRSMSLEDLRLEKRGGGTSNIIDENKSYGLQSPTELKSFVEKSSDQSHRLRGDFASNLTSYISYFDRSEAISQKAKQKIMNKYFVKNEAGGKGSQFLKKELEIAHNEMKGMKRHMDLLQNKVFELVKMNKHLIKELGDMKTREDDYLLKLKEIEGQFIQINQRKDHYKHKYLQAHEMLEMERNENENNVVLLKKLLSSNHNIHNTLETKMAIPYSANAGTSAMRDKAKEKEHLKYALKEAIQHKKECGINMTRLKEKKPSGAHIYSNNRYDPQYNQKSKKTREMSKYNISSMLKPAGGMRSEEEEYIHHNHENNEESEASQRHVNFEESEGEDEEGQQEDYEKMLTKEQQIKLLQEKLFELEGTQDTHQFAYEKNLNQQKKMMKQHHKGSDISPQNIFTIREKERKTSHMKASQLPMRYDHHVKMKSKNEMGMESPGGDAVNIHNFRSQNDSD